MGICYSSIRGKGNAQQEEDIDCWWKSKDGKLVGVAAGGGGGGAAADDRALQQTPGRLFGNGSSNIACLYTLQGKKGTNQDAMIVWENFSSRSDTVFCGVFDGHGPYGHMVAKKVRDALPVLLCSQWKAANSNADQSEAEDATGSTNFEECMDEDWSEQLDIENEKLPEIYQPLKQSILKTFKLMDKDLKFHPTIDCFCSGSTAVTLVKQGDNIIIGNVGDSRAVLATRETDGTLTAIQLTVDLKPNLPREAARIQQCNGRVFALQDEPEVSRVWLPNNDSPGLAMARAFGDFCLKDFGLISVPNVYYRHLKEKDEFIILATDGVWDVLSNKEAVDIIDSAPSRATAARAVVDAATRAWKLKYPTSKNDDCAVVCLTLEHMPEEAKDAPPMNNPARDSEDAVKRTPLINGDATCPNGFSASHNPGTEPLGSKDSGEIVPVSESEKILEKFPCQSKRSLAECISTTEEEEWCALEGITRVNSLLSLPRFLSGDKRSASWRKWL